jgi:hypothetical protein
MPANGLAVSRSARNVPTVPAAVRDPYAPKERILVSVNRRVDILEEELANGRIDEAQYHTGRRCQAIFERAGGVSASSWNMGDRVDAYVAKELQIIHSLMDADRVRREIEDMQKVIGTVGARMLRAVLSGTSFKQIATARGKTGDRAVSAVAQQFRWYLEDLSEARAARGVREPAARREDRPTDPQ